jgi:hypothetical protein
MSDPTNDRDETTENELKPTITIAELDGDDREDDGEAKPTITIAEKEGDN